MDLPLSDLSLLKQIVLAVYILSLTRVHRWHILLPALLERNSLLHLRHSRFLLVPMVISFEEEYV